MELTKVQWCIDQHRNTKHLYDNYLPYEFHLRMVVNNCRKFLDLAERQCSELEIACWGHDLIEDTRVSYNDCKKVLGEYASDIIYAVTNDKGKNRKERAGEKYYDGIRNTEGAVFVKLCDRIANVEYSKMTGSKMFDMYKLENSNFIDRLALPFEYRPMSDRLTALFNSLPSIDTNLIKKNKEG